MRTLYHLWLSPFSRKVRLVLKEKTLDFDMKVEPVWERRAEFLALNPAGDVPVLVEPDGATLCDATAIVEFLEETYPERPLIGSTPAERAETRRLVAWFDVKFNREVTVNLVDEKMMKRFLGLGQPNSQAIRAGCQNIKHHLDYIGYLTDRRKYLAGDAFGLADITAAAHLSSVDYLGDVPWEQHDGAKDWYARVKSRPSFRPLLSDHIPGAAPPKHYADLDF
jgi:glutathione S-transferase